MAPFQPARKVLIRLLITRFYCISHSTSSSIYHCVLPCLNDSIRGSYTLVLTNYNFFLENTMSIMGLDPLSQFLVVPYSLVLPTASGFARLVGSTSKVFVICLCLVTLTTSGLHPLVDSAFLLFVEFLVPVIWGRNLLEAVSGWDSTPVIQD